jgi:rSAM-partnered protein
MSDASTARTRVTEPRSDGAPAWEVFVRPDAGDTLSHAGSVRAPTREGAADQATALFPDAHTIWACPGEDVLRLTDRSLGETDAESAGDVPADPGGADGTEEGEPVTPTGMSGAGDPTGGEGT